ncbi:HicB family toxin-antitoxin system [Sanguibacter inulinus]|uniref:HicB family toxin-antitoxin system n=1 Tax=Sanguibacter inulinus TaxID=60922 RepID=A0A853EQE8_9MICO|nr:HicB family toxin-antitoxin system [Sanguibacter inulinus]MBF0721664.1 HicB family toxin-antitoxin system [Sanguibacter inulinus]NYS92809.1 HicB family toxin-antitoxin system [Sanguibacter inulinus]
MSTGTTNNSLHVIANVSRDGRWWMVEVPGIGLTQARRLAEVESMARGLVAVVRDVSEDDVQVTVHYQPVDGVDVAAELEAIEDARRLAAEYEQRVRQQTRALALALAERHVPQRDIGAVLGVSGQRAHQLLSA